MKILVGISGASGVELGFYLLNALEKYINANDEIFAIVSNGAKTSFCAENSFYRHCERAESEVWQSTNSHLRSKKSELKAQNLNQNDEFIAFCKEKFALHKTQFFDDENLAASVASGSFGVSATIIAPCSLNSLAKIKRGIADTLITRSAAVALKERKKLILAVREMPFSTLTLKQMTKLSKMGVIIAPPVFASYTHATNLDELRNFIIGKWLDLLEIKHDLYKKWQNS